MTPVVLSSNPASEVAPTCLPRRRVSVVIPARNEEGKAYLEKWMTAVAPATNRDYEAAVGRVEQAGKSLLDPSISTRQSLQPP